MAEEARDGGSAEAEYDAAGKEAQQRHTTPDPDILRWPDEEPPKKQVWEVPPKYEWEREERSYIFEEKLQQATAMRERGNEHFRASEWELALRRYRRALYHGHLDEMQMFDLTEEHKAAVLAVLAPCKLNLACCIVRMAELGEPLDAGAVEHAEEAVNDVIKQQPENGKAYFRRGQLALLQLDLPKAREALDKAHKLAGGAGVREARARLNQLLKEERERDREMFGGKLQKTSLHQAQEARLARRKARWALMASLASWLFFPFIWPLRQLFALISMVWDMVGRRFVHSRQPVKEKAL
ncbi:hypothetical protein AB1Y20_002993 [Prymnesium parvum]|uniref:Peptidylprolyl isomerase n=1 Tax=Prymnesium parvum TaxID=97485 RepID=A0AB34JAS2_PRYPA